MIIKNRFILFICLISLLSLSVFAVDPEVVVTELDGDVVIHSFTYNETTGIIEVPDYPGMAEATIGLPYGTSSAIRVTGLYVRENTSCDDPEEDPYRCFEKAVPYAKYENTSNETWYNNLYMDSETGRFTFNVEHFTDYYVGLVGSYKTLGACLKGINGTDDICYISVPGTYAIGEWDINASKSSFDKTNLELAFDFDVDDDPDEYDLSGQGNDGTINSATWQSAGAYGGSYYYNGSNYISVADSPDFDFSSDFSLEAWLNPDSITSEVYAISRFTDFRLGVTSSGYARVSINDSGGTIRNCDDTVALTPGTWNHIVGTYDGSNLRLYVNGLMKRVCVASGPVKQAAVPLIIGCQGPGLTNCFNGSIDQVRVWSKELSHYDVSDRFAGIGLYDTGEAALRITGQNVNVYCNGTEMRNSRPTDFGKYGIRISADNVVLDGCRATEWYYGIEITASNRENITLSNNYVAGRSSGIYDAYSGPGVLIENNYLTDGVAYGLSYGIYVRGGNLTVVRNNTVVGVSIGGIRVHSAYKNTVVDNTLINNGNGVMIVRDSAPGYYCHENNVTGNTIKGSTTYDIDIQGGTYSCDDNLIWLNNFLKTTSPINDLGTDNIFCFNGEGNFYVKGVTPETSDCGQGILNNVTTDPVQTSYSLSWSKQSSPNTVNYDIFVNHGYGLYQTDYIKTVTGLSTSYDFINYAGENVSVTILPWIEGSRYNGTEMEGESFIVGNGTGGGGLPTPQEQCQESQSIIFAGFSILALMVIVGGAFIIIMLLKGGDFDVGMIMAMVLGLIGAVVVIFVGYIAVSYIGASVCF